MPLSNPSFMQPLKLLFQNIHVWLFPLLKVQRLSSQTPKHGILNILQVFKHQHPLYSLINYLLQATLNSLLNEHTNLCQCSRSLLGLVFQSVINTLDLDLILWNPSQPLKFNSNAISSIKTLWSFPASQNNSVLPRCFHKNSLTPLLAIISLSFGC